MVRLRVETRGPRAPVRRASTRGTGLWRSAVVWHSWLSHFQGALNINAQVPLPGIRQHRDHALALAQSLGHLQRGPDVGPGRYADEQALRPCQPLRRLESVLVLDGYQLIVDFAVQHSRHEAGADALDAVQARLAASQHTRTSR